MYILEGVENEKVSDVVWVNSNLDDALCENGCTESRRNHRRFEDGRSGSGLTSATAVWSKVSSLSRIPRNGARSVTLVKVSQSVSMGSGRRSLLSTAE